MGGVVGNLFGGGQEQAYKDYENQLRQGMDARKYYQGSAEQALGPYNNPHFIGDYYNELNKQRNAPQYFNDLMSNYKTSPYAQQLMQQGQQALGSAASSSGMLGSGAYGQHSAEMAENIASKDMQDYFNNMMGIRNQYLGGLGDLSHMGYGSATNIFGGRQQLGQDIASMYGQLGQAKMGQAMSHSAGINNLLGQIAQFGIGALSGGLGWLPGIGAGIAGAFKGGFGIPGKD